MKFRIDYIHPAPSIVIASRILTASDWSDVVNKTKGMIDDGYRITGVHRVPDHIEPTPWYK